MTGVQSTSINQRINLLWDSSTYEKKTHYPRFLSIKMFLYPIPFVPTLYPFRHINLFSVYIFPSFLVIQIYPYFIPFIPTFYPILRQILFVPTLYSFFYSFTLFTVYTFPSLLLIQIYPNSIPFIPTFYPIFRQMNFLYQLFIHFFSLFYPLHSVHIWKFIRTPYHLYHLFYPIFRQMTFSTAYHTSKLWRWKSTDWHLSCALVSSTAVTRTQSSVIMSSPK